MEPNQEGPRGHRVKWPVPIASRDGTCTASVTCTGRCWRVGNDKLILHLLGVCFDIFLQKGWAGGAHYRPHWPLQACFDSQHCCTTSPHLTIHVMQGRGSFRSNCSSVSICSSAVAIPSPCCVLKVCSWTWIALRPPVNQQGVLIYSFPFSQNFSFPFT
jgi:hypothetical protein